MSLLDRIKAHSQPAKVRTIEVPEWGEPAVYEADGETIKTPAAPLIVHYTMVTLGDMADAQAACVAANMAGNTMRLEAEMVCLKSRDAAGQPLFSRIEVIELMKLAAPEVVHRIANTMMARASTEDIAKN